MANKVNIKDVAALAGVSRATVSRVLNGTAVVSPETALAVQRAVDATGYTINAQAQALALGRTNTIGVLLTEPFDELYEDPTYSSIMRGITDALAETQMFPVLFQAYTPSEREKAFRIIKRGAVDAVIHLSPFDDPEGLATLATSRIPVVLCGQLLDIDYSDRFSCVYADDIEGAEIAAWHIADLGRSTIGLIMGEKDAPATRDRLIGYANVLGDKIADDRVIFGGWDQITGARGIEELLQRDPRIDTVICGSDRIAAGAMEFLHARGIEVPRQIAIIGFDDHRVASQTSPTMTTIAQPMNLQGRKAAELALDMLAGGAPQTVVLEMELKKRESA